MVTERISLHFAGRDQRQGHPVGVLVVKVLA